MESLLSTLAAAGGALLAVAVFIACWEQLRQGDSRPAPSPPLERAVSVDVNLEALPPAPAAPETAAESEQRQRQSVLGAALAGMVRGPTETVSPGLQSWAETAPMVAPGPARQAKERKAEEQGEHYA